MLQKGFFISLSTCNSFLKQIIGLEACITQLFIQFTKYALLINLSFSCVLFNAHLRIPSLTLSNIKQVLSLHCAKYCSKYFQFTVIYSSQKFYKVRYIITPNLQMKKFRHGEGDFAQIIQSGQPGLDLQSPRCIRKLYFYVKSLDLLMVVPNSNKF